VGRLRRLRRYHGQIVSYFINYFRAEHIRRLPRAKLTKRSFIEIFQESTRIRLKKLEQRVESVIAEMDLASARHRLRRGFFLLKTSTTESR
jgi:DNA-binding GntR family transcriptional regulator